MVATRLSNHLHQRNELSLNSFGSDNIITKDDPDVESVSLELHECVIHFFPHIKKF